MIWIPAHRLSRHDLELIGNNVLPQVCADRARRLAPPADVVPLSPPKVDPASLADVDRSLAVHGAIITH